MKFPIYLNDGKSLCPLTDFQISAIKEVVNKITSGEYKLVANSCLCLNESPDRDIVISEKDRYGFPVPSLLCSKCGIIRSGHVFDEFSNSDFYKNEYRSIYVGSKIPPLHFFDNQTVRGRELFAFWKKVLPEVKLSNVFEVGCGAGGILQPFADSGVKCAGNDYDIQYLDFGRSKGFDLNYGNYYDFVANNSADLIILSHVMEHFLDPIHEMQNIVSKIRPGGYLLVEVPGIFYIDKSYYSPILYLQNAHVFSYYYDYLYIFFQQLGLEVVTGNERCTFILKKPLQWNEQPINSIYDSTLTGAFDKIAKYIFATHIRYQLKLNPHQWRARVVRLLNRVGFPAHKKFS